MAQFDSKSLKPALQHCQSSPGNHEPHNNTKASVPSTKPYLQSIIPAEIRAIIFRYLLVSSLNLPHSLLWVGCDRENITFSAEQGFRLKVSAKKKTSSSKTNERRKLYPDILATCSLFYNEGSPILYSQNAFVMREDIARSWRFQSAITLADITHLVFKQSLYACLFLEAETLSMGKQFPALKTVTFMADSSIVYPPPSPTLGQTRHQIARVVSSGGCERRASEKWRYAFQQFRERQPPLKRLEFRLERFQDVLPLMDEEDDAEEPQVEMEYLFPHLNVSSAQSMTEDDPDVESVAATIAKLEIAKKVPTYTSHPLARYRIPLQFDEHRKIKALAHIWLGEPHTDGIEWRFETHTSWAGHPRLRVHMIASAKPSATILCEVTGAWGHMSRVEEL
ncbi:hypothetical protein BT63DRAFT_419025 [Microthyrium microscopicum]|uniref:F-box domain-containing protein n=1 Tax=Microthyrium microscopicum TaxID=703497 RepID=A0A6A6TY25_9PEZI|nr:hypothetical protein BT63DRAFT_419025 [Microthyrium microscopicum]